VPELNDIDALDGAANTRDRTTDDAGGLYGAVDAIGTGEIAWGVGLACGSGWCGASTKVYDELGSDASLAPGRRVLSIASNVLFGWW